jgi:hypothetical protein
MLPENSGKSSSKYIHSRQNMHADVSTNTNCDINNHSRESIRFGTDLVRVLVQLIHWLSEMTGWTHVRELFALIVC